MIGSLSFDQIIGRLKAVPYGRAITFNQISTDTRDLKPGDLFVALNGASFDGQIFLRQALDAGAVGAILSHHPSCDCSALVVSNTTDALGTLGLINREKFDGMLLAITGSAGKTTVKEMAASILKQQKKVLATQGNFNNEIGVPLTLLNIDDSHEVAIIELGASSIGEIAYTSALVKPDVAIITNAADAHIEGFGSLNNIVQAKGEIIDALTADGTVILNIDDLNSYKWIERADGRNCISFSLDQKSGANYYASNYVINSDGTYQFKLESPIGSVAIKLNYLGKHNVANALAAAAGSIALGASLIDVKLGLEQATPLYGRLITCKGYHDAVVIDDSYNANPESLRVAIDVLCQYSGTKILVLGDMSELGDEALQAHQEAGRYAKKQGVDELLTVGHLSAYAAQTFGVYANSYDNKNLLIDALKPLLTANTIVLVKGSRSSSMEDVIKAITVVGEQ